MQVCSKQEMLDFYSVLATHDYFFRCYMYLLFRVEFATCAWCRNNFLLHSWQVFIVRIEPMLRVPRLYTLDRVKHDFSTWSWSCVNAPGLRTRLFPSWCCIKWPSLRWSLHTSHGGLYRWTKGVESNHNISIISLWYCLLLYAVVIYLIVI
jgi:hypothetical protein